MKNMNSYDIYLGEDQEPSKIPIKKIKRILDMHSVPNYEKDGRIYADSMISGYSLFQEVEDVTDWTFEQLFAWLGY